MQQSPTAAETKPTAGHTPGPWAVHPFKARVDAFETGGALPICQMLWPTELRSEEATEANARLIAAAPDLLDALVMVRDADEDCRSDGLPTIPPPARAKIDAAIAKAEGR